MSNKLLPIFFIINLLATLNLFSQNQGFPLISNEQRLRDSIKARELIRIGAYLYDQNMYKPALDTFFLSLEIRKKLYGDLSPELGTAYMAIGTAYRNLGQLEQSLIYFKYAEDSYLNTKELKYSTISSLYYNIGNVYRDKLDYAKSLQYFEQAYTMLIKTPNVQNEKVAEINYGIAEIYYKIGEYDKALDIINNNIKNAYAEDQFLYFDLLSFIYNIRGNFSEAQKYYVAGIELAKSTFGENDLKVADKYLSYSNFLINISQFDKAESMLKKAWQIIEFLHIKDGPLLAVYYLYSGDLVSQRTFESKDMDQFKKQYRQNITEAIDKYLKGVNALRFPEEYTPDSINTDNILSLTNCIQILNKIGDSYIELWRLETGEQKSISKSLSEAINTYQIISTLIQQARKSITNDEGKIQLTSLEYSTFVSLIQSTYYAYTISNDVRYLELAFQNAERTRGSSVFDRLSEQFALDNSLIPDSLLELETHYNNTISSLSSKFIEESNNVVPNNTLIDEYKNKIFLLGKSKDSLYQFMESKYSDYYELKYSNSMISAREIQKKLSKDQVLIEYVLHENDTLSDTDTITELYVFIISSDEINFIKQDVPPDFISDIEGVFKFMSNRNFLFTKNDDSKAFCISSHNLYNVLIKPYLGIIKNKNLTIVPDGKLSYIPFDALLKTLPDTTKMIEFNKLSYLVRDFCVNYSISSNLLFKNKNTDHKTGIKTLAFAPEYNNEIINVGGLSFKLASLPGVKKEVEQISDIIDTELFEGERATEANFRNNAGKYDILHLAMHAFINDSLPAMSSLVFTQSGNSSNNFKELLNTSDIYALKLKAKLTVLSACNTGTGKLLKGEGIMSLARGFLYAGCPSIIMSFWEVEDESGTDIMSGFYKNLKKGKNKDEALRLAKLEYLDSSSSRLAHPHYWLGFVSIGDNSSFFISYDFYFFVLLILALAGIGIDQLIRIKKARNKRALQ